MTRLDPILELALESARAAREPSAADRARNLAALEARLGLEPLEPGSDPEGSTAAAPLRTAPGVRALKWKLASLGLVTAAAGFATGLYLGRQASSLEQLTSAVQAPAAQAAAGVAAHAAPLELPAPATPAGAAPAAGTVTAGPVSSQHPAAESQQRAARRLPRRSSPAEPRRAQPSRETVHAPRTAADRTFLAALRLLERAQRSLERSEAPYAMSLLDELDARFPARLLAEERQVTRALGWCALGDALQAARVASSLLRDNPRSIYAARLARSCVRPAPVPAGR